MITARVYFKTLLNPDKVNEKGWEVADFEYHIVAEIDFEEAFVDSEGDMMILQLVWDYIQNVTNSWTDSPHIRSFGNTIRSMIDRRTLRSMMVDDVIEWKGVLYKVAPFGFSKVEL